MLFTAHRRWPGASCVINEPFIVRTELMTSASSAPCFLPSLPASARPHTKTSIGFALVITALVKRGELVIHACIGSTVNSRDSALLLGAEATVNTEAFQHLEDVTTTYEKPPRRIAGVGSLLHSSVKAGASAAGISRGPEERIRCACHASIAILAFERVSYLHLFQI